MSGVGDTVGGALGGVTNTVGGTVGKFPPSQHYLHGFTDFHQALSVRE